MSPEEVYRSVLDWQRRIHAPPPSAGQHRQDRRGAIELVGAAASLGEMPGDAEARYASSAPHNFTDDFNRANAGTLGANWNQTAAGWGIVGNTASNAGVADDATYAGWIAYATCSVQVLVTSATPGTFGVIVCGQALGSGQGYYAVIEPSGGFQRLAIYRNRGGVLLANSGNFAFAAGSSATLTFNQSTGQLIWGYDVQFCIATDATYPGGRVGISCVAGPAAYDYFTVTG